MSDPRPIIESALPATPWLDIRTFVGGGDRVLTDDAQSDWSPVFERAIAEMHRLSVSGVSQLPQPEGRPSISATLYLPRGTYFLSRPIVIARYLSEDRLFATCSLSIVGEAAGAADTPCARLRIRGQSPRDDVSGPSLPAIIIQGARVVHLRNLVLSGDNDWSRGFGRLDILRLHFTEPTGGADPYRVIGGAEILSAPYAGVCIDPFRPEVPSAQQYSGFADFYRPRRLDPQVLLLPERCSARVLIEGCEIDGFEVGVSVAPSGLPVPPAAAFVCRPE